MASDEEQYLNFSSGEELIGRMKFLRGAAYDADKGTIRCPSSAAGYVVYGPYVICNPGLYEVELNIQIHDTGKIHHVTVELFGSDIIYSSAPVNCSSDSFRFTGFVDRLTLLEVRVHSIRNEIEISSLKIRLVEQNLSQDEANFHHQSLQRLIAAVHGREAVSIEDKDFDRIFNNPRFSLMTFADVRTNTSRFRSSGIDPARIEQFLFRNFDEPAVGDDLTNGHPSLRNRFQLDIVQNGVWELPSFRGGGTMVSRSSIPVLTESDSIATIVYEFVEDGTILIGTSCGWAGSISFVWFVEENILLHEDKYWSSWRVVTNVIRDYLRLVVRHREAVQAYRRAPKATALAVGFITNLGHYFWNDLSGCERLVRKGASVDTVLVRNGVWLHPRECFGQTLGRTYVDVSSAGLFEHVLSNNLLVVRPTATLIDRPLARKICSAAEAVFAQNSNAKYTSAREAADANFVIFANVRVHNKMWLEQVEGMISVAHFFAEKQDRPVALYVDGFSDCQPVLNEIRSRSGGSIEIISGLDAGMVETIYWASRASFFVAAIGSGLTLVTWLADKPGFCHGDTGHLVQESFWKEVADTKEQVVWATEQQIRDEQDMYYANYHLDPAVVLETIKREFF